MRKKKREKEDEGRRELEEKTSRRLIKKII